MKEILASQYHAIAGGYGEQCGSGPSNANSNGCSGGSDGRSGNSGGRAPQITNSKGKPGSGVLAGSFFTNNPGSSAMGSGGCTGGSREGGSKR